MNSFHVTEKLALWAGGDLSEQEMASIQAHLDVCHACKSEAIAYKEAIAWLQMPLEIPFSKEERTRIRNSVMTKIRSDKSTKKKKSTVRPFVPLLLATAASIPAFLLFGNSVLKKQEPPTVVASAKPDVSKVGMASEGTGVAHQGANEIQANCDKAVTTLIRPSTIRYAKHPAKDQRVQPVQLANYWPDPTITRIEIQTEDPSIKIILVPPSTTTDLFGDTHEQPS